MNDEISKFVKYEIVFWHKIMFKNLRFFQITNMQLQHSCVYLKQYCHLGFKKKTKDKEYIEIFICASIRHIYRCKMQEAKDRKIILD